MELLSLHYSDKNNTLLFIGNRPFYNGVSCFCLDPQALFIEINTANLQALKAGDVLLDMCLNLPYLTRHVHKYLEAVVEKKGISLPSTHSEATFIRVK